MCSFGFACIVVFLPFLMVFVNLAGVVVLEFGFCLFTAGCVISDCRFVVDLLFA